MLRLFQIFFPLNITSGEPILLNCLSSSIGHKNDNSRGPSCYLLVQNRGSSLPSPQSFTLLQYLFSGTQRPLLHVCSDMAHWWRCCCWFCWFSWACFWAAVSTRDAGSASTPPSRMRGDASRSSNRAGHVASITFQLR